MRGEELSTKATAWAPASGRWDAIAARSVPHASALRLGAAHSPSRWLWPGRRPWVPVPSWAGLSPGAQGRVGGWMGSVVTGAREWGASPCPTLHSSELGAPQLLPGCPTGIFLHQQSPHWGPSWQHQTPKPEPWPPPPTCLRCPPLPLSPQPRPGPQWAPRSLCSRTCLGLLD